MSTLNRLLGLLLGLAILGVGVLAIVEAATAGMGRSGVVLQRGEWDELLRGLEWDDRRLTITAAVVLLAGVTLLVLQLWPATPSWLRVEGATSDRRAVVEGRGLKELLRRWATEDQEVLGASVRLRRRRARVTVSAPSDADVAAARARVRQHLRERIDDLPLEKPLRAKVAVQRVKQRVT